MIKTKKVVQVSNVKQYCLLLMCSSNELAYLFNTLLTLTTKANLEGSLAHILL